MITQLTPDINQDNQPNDRHFSRVLWIPFLWLLISFSRGRLSPQATGMDAFSEGTLSLRIIYSTLILIGTIILVRRGFFHWGARFVRKNKWLVLIYVLMGLSLLWTDSMGVTLRRWVKTAGVVVMVLIVLTETDALASMSALLRRLFCIAIPASLFLALFVPSYGRCPIPNNRIMWVGITPHKNSLGQLAALGAMYFIWHLIQKEFPRRKRFDWLFLGISLATLLASGSMTSLFALFFFVALLFFMQTKKAKARHTGLVVIYSALLIALAYVVLNELVINVKLTAGILSAFGREPTLTGRTDLWGDLLPYAFKRPMLGYGFGAFWQEQHWHELWVRHDWQPNDAHNGYLDIFLGLGLVGLVCMLGIIVSGYRDATKMFTERFEFARLRLLLIFVILIHNTCETTLCNLNHPYWFMFLFAVIAMPAIERPDTATVRKIRGRALPPLGASRD